MYADGRMYAEGEIYVCRWKDGRKEKRSVRSSGRKDRMEGKIDWMGGNELR